MGEAEEMGIQQEPIMEEAEDHLRERRLMVILPRIKMVRQHRQEAEMAGTDDLALKAMVCLGQSLAEVEEELCEQVLTQDWEEMEPTAR
jgi:hypothetical protein